MIKILGDNIISYKGKELPFKPIVPREEKRYVLSQMETLVVIDIVFSE